MTEPVFGLTAGAAKVVRSMADTHRQRLPAVGRRTRRVWPKGGRGGSPVIRFQVIETNCDRCSAVVRVLSWPKGQKPTGDTDDYDYENDQLRVWDMTDSFFNKPPIEVLNGVGYAVKLYHETESAPRCDIQYSERWEVLWMRCEFSGAGEVG